MKELKNYSNLYGLYKKYRNGTMIAFFVCLGLFLFSFVSILLDFPFAITIIMMLMIFGVLLAGILWLAGHVRTGNSLKQFTPQELRFIDNEIPMRQMCDGFIVTGYAIVCGKGMLLLYPMRNVLWIYNNVAVTRYCGIIPIAKNTTLVIAGRDRTVRGYNIKNKSNVISFLQSEIWRYRKDVIYGYSPELYNMFNNNINQMIGMAQEYARQQGGNL